MPLHMFVLARLDGQHQACTVRMRCIAVALVAGLLIRPMRVQRAFRCSVLPKGRRGKYYARVSLEAPVVRAVSDRWSITVTMASTLHGPGTTSCHAVGYPH